MAARRGRDPRLLDRLWQPLRGITAGPRGGQRRPAFGQYKPTADGTRFDPWCIQVPEITDGRISHLHHFLDTSLFPRFGLPPYLEA